jgi:hypothetical protein
MYSLDRDDGNSGPAIDDVSVTEMTDKANGQAGQNTDAPPGPNRSDAAAPTPSKEAPDRS